MKKIDSWIVLCIVSLAAAITVCVYKYNETRIETNIETETISEVSEISETETTTAIEKYVTHGRYYTEGKVITDDGNVWIYQTDIISETEPYDGMPVYVGMHDNGSPEDLEDDVILGLVRDIETSIYDELEASLKEMDGYTVTRNGNEICIEKE